jgi:hypothetical protein
MIAMIVNTQTGEITFEETPDEITPAPTPEEI